MFLPAGFTDSFCSKWSARGWKNIDTAGRLKICCLPLRLVHFWVKILVLNGAIILYHEQLIIILLYWVIDVLINNLND